METLVAVFVLMISIIAPMSIASQALSAARYAKDQVTAAYLAQEGIELVRNIRDNNVLSSPPITWNEGTLGLSSVGSKTLCYANNCAISAIDLSVSVCTNDICGPLVLDENNGIYGYSGTPTPLNSVFTRKIFLEKVSDNEIKVTSSVSWSNGGSGVSIPPIVITDTLFNWP